MEDALRKTNRINLLFDFYQSLLTDKQQLYLKYYFHDDYSLGEISDLFGISRQAVNEHIKRAEHLLENYEDKLGLLAHHAYRQRQLHKLHALAEELDESQRQRMQTILHEMAEADEPEAARHAAKTTTMKGGTDDGV